MIVVQRLMDCGCALLQGGGVRRCPQHDVRVGANEVLEKELHLQRARERERRTAEMASIRG